MPRALAPEPAGLAGRVGPREQGIAGGDEIRQRPQQRGDRDPRDDPHPRRPVRAAPQPQPVGGRERPALRPQQPRQHEQHPDHAPAPRPRRLERRRRHDERGERHVDERERRVEAEVQPRHEQRRRQHARERPERRAPEVVGRREQHDERQHGDERHRARAGVAERREQGPDRDPQRVLRRRPEVREAGRRTAEDLPPPDERVQRVVGRQDAERKPGGDRDDHHGRQPRDLGTAQPGRARISVHGVAPRTATTGAWADTSSAIARRDQWCRWPGVSPSARMYAPARDVQHAPQRLVRHGHDHGAARDPRRLGERAIRILDELQHLDEADEVELVVGERQRLRVADDVVDAPAGAVPGGPQARRLDVQAGHPPAGRARDPARDDPLAAADVEHGLRRHVGDERVERGEKRRQQPPDDRVRGAVLVVDVAGDRGGGHRGDDVRMTHGGTRAAHRRRGLHRGASRARAARARLVA